ncbi:DUF2213 domain-containing protein, partial [Providencia rettgeri]
RQMIIYRLWRMKTPSEKCPNFVVQNNGIMHVSKTPISKANVCRYLGKEIKDWQLLNLQPDKYYRLYRDPEELNKGAATFNNKPVLNQHLSFSIINPPKEAIVGMTGDDAVFEYPYLFQSMTITDGAMQAGIESDKHREISPSYYYRADMTAGVTPDGEEYDGVMRDIVCNHVAIVPDGRTGRDVLIYDEKPKGYDFMTKLEKFWSALLPKLANDANPEEIKDELDNLVKDDEKQAADTSHEQNDEQNNADKPAEDEDKDAIIAELRAEIAELKKPAEDTDEKVEKAVSVATDSMRREFRALREAERLCQPHVGNLACDSAEELYIATLKNAGVETKGVHPSALKPMVQMLSSSKSLAQDSVTSLTRDIKSSVLTMINGGN